MEDMNARNNTPQSSVGNVGMFASVENPRPTLLMNSWALPMQFHEQSQYGLSLIFYPVQTVASTNQLVAASTCPNPIMSVPWSVVTPNQN